MNTLATRRVVALRPPKSASGQKKIPLDQIARRRQAALKLRWELEKSLGRDLRVARVDREKGSNGSMASQCLNGARPLNVEWMLLFAGEMDLSPQEIWGDDWPYPDLTPGDMSPTLGRLIRRWRMLSRSAQVEILRIIQADKKRRYT